MAMTVTFYGTRGGIMSVSRDRLIYGGHTTCLSIASQKELLIIDAGFGIANLGAKLMQEYDITKGGYSFHLLLTHFHWDHIQGLQYFTPIYFPNNHIYLHSPFPEKEVREVFDLLLDDSYSPFNGLNSLPCTWHLEQLKEETEIGIFTISHHPTVHLGESYAYRIKNGGKTLVFSGDHDAAESKRNDDFVNWATGCDLLIHEAMYTPAEYQRSPGFGHSSFITAMANAKRINAPLTLLTHHEPLRSDSELGEHERYMERLYNKKDRRLAFAREDIEYQIK